jgi:hypothetical protein
MGEKWNSGAGGYTCDTCGVLLWAGHDGKDKPQYRRWWYTCVPDDIIEFGHLAFCSKTCSRGYLLEILVRLSVVGQLDRESFIKRNTRGTGANDNY